MLVVDDEPQVTHHLVQGLSLLGLCALGAGSAAAALQILHDDPRVAVVITDIRMPNQDGLSLAQAITGSREEDQAIEIIVMTGHATLDDAAAAMRSRVSDFLRKPFRLAEAMRALTAGLDRAQRRRAQGRALKAQSLRLRALEAERSRLAAEMEAASLRLAKAPAPPGLTWKLERDMHAISHALRTPLVAISGGAELLGMPAQQQQEAEYLALLRNGVSQAREAVELVEELHQVERPVASPRQENVPLAALVAQQAALLQPEAAARSLRLEAGPLEPLSCTGDRARLRRAVALCLGAAMEWAPRDSQIGVRLDRAALAAAPGAETGGEAGSEAGAGAPLGGWAVLTVSVFPGPAPGQAPPPGIAFPEPDTVWSRTQEGLRFAIARHLAEQHDGRLTSWNGGAGTMALRLSLPL
ncbi:response regulator [Roseomonas sp. BU-1]|uniref:histidine kinase n=1 Tax=Falsiroseomonas selenitidurans TaxID=2716335 RepID=A0ABX1E836_9PROT|nr:response regulator [Falsiroseomonas selenitidurans]